MTACPIATRLAGIETRIRQACAAAGRPRESVRLLAASKGHPPASITAALRAGHTLFGENRAQSLRDKFDEFASQDETLPRPEWHFIGHLQKNKIRLVVGRATLIHTLDSLALAQQIANRLVRQAEAAGTDGAPMPVLIEVNVANESTKAGVSIDETLALAHQIAAVPQLDLQGLMTIPPWSTEPGESRVHFDRLAALAAEGRAQGLDLHQLSMGMTGDLEEAIAAGSTIVRVGTGIFGRRG